MAFFFGYLKQRLGHRQRVLFVAPLLFVWLGLGTGCFRHGREIEVEMPGGVRAKLQVSETLRINMTAEPPTLDWIKSSDTASTLVTTNLMEGLVQYDLSATELTPKPGLATKWEPSDSARKWKITLRQGVLWSDGVAFEAQHVIDGWKRLLASETASTYSYFLFGIKNAQAFNQGRVPWEEVGVAVTGPFEISVELERPMSYFPSLLTHHSTYPVRLDLIRKFGNAWTEPPNLVTLGPFTLKAWQHDKMIVLERNERYYDQAPAIRFIALYMLQEQGTALSLFDSGQLDAVNRLASVELRKLRSRPEYREKSLLATNFYGLNIAKPPLDKAEVRRALSMAIDRQELVQMLAGGQLPLTGWIPPGMFGYQADRGLSFDPSRARELLKRAGYSDRSKMPRIEIRFNTSEDTARVAENIQAQLKKNLGIEVEIKNEEWKVYLNNLKVDPPQIFRFGWLADYPDPDNFLSIVAGYSANNHTRWKNPRFDELVRKAAGTVDRDARKKIYAEAEKILLEEDVPVVPLFTSVNHLLVARRVENFPVNSMDVLAFKSVRLKK